MRYFNSCNISCRGWVNATGKLRSYLGKWFNEQELFFDISKIT